MDPFVLKSYRSVTDDLLLLYDAYMIAKNTRRGLRSTSEYLNVVKMLISEEALDEDRLLQHVDSEFGDNGSRRGMSLQDAAEGESSTSSLSYSLHPPGEGGFHYKPSFDNVFKTTWEFFRTVVLQFLVEEASQYFLWSTKAAVVLNDDVLQICSDKKMGLAVFRLWMTVLRLRWTRHNYEGLLPYLCAKAFSQMEYILVQIKRYTYISLANRTGSRVPNGTLLKKKKQFSANTLIMSRSLSTSENNSEVSISEEPNSSMKSVEEDHQNASFEKTLEMASEEPPGEDNYPSRKQNEHPNSVTMLPGYTSNPPSMMTPGMMLHRCMRCTLAHPFFVVVLLMIKNEGIGIWKNIDGHSMGIDSTLSNNSGVENRWVPLVLEIAARRGSLYILFRGLRSVIAACLVPYDFVFLGFGVAETLLYRRMTRPVLEDELSDIKERSLDANIYTSSRILTTGTRGLLLEAQGMTMKHGISSLCMYSAMSCFLYLPGLCNFIAARSILFLIAGPSATRRRQLMQRKRLVHKKLSSGS